MKYEWTFGAATFKRRLIFLMEEQGLSQQTVAEFAGVSQQTVSRWLSDSKPELENVTALASRAGVPLSWLAYGKGHLKLSYGGVDGFIHRAKNRTITRLTDALKTLSSIEENDFLHPEEQEIIQAIREKLAKRRLRLSECVEALEKLPPSDEALLTDILSKLKSPSATTERMDISWLFGLDASATDEEILEACRLALKKNPRPRLAARKSDLKPKAKT